MNNLLTIKQINRFDVTFMNIELGNDKWVTAYVRLDNPLPDEYEYETYREGNVIGIDTMHYYNQKMTFNEKVLDAERQIKYLIKDYQSKIIKE